MAIKFQYNKTSLNEITKQLKVRTRALPTLKNKESALRLEVRKAKSRSDELASRLEASLKEYGYMAALWNEFEPGLISVKDVEVETVKIAGVKTPELKNIIYEIRDFNAFSKPAWFADGVRILKELAKIGIESEIYTAKSRILDFQRKKNDPEGKSVRESANPRLPGSHPQDQTVHGRRRKPVQGITKDCQDTSRRRGGRK